MMTLFESDAGFEHASEGAAAVSCARMPIRIIAQHKVTSEHT